MWLVTTANVQGNLPFRLKTGLYTAGRTRPAQIQIRDATVSREHARLICTPDYVDVQDLASRNGTIFHGERVMQCRLLPGDRICFGAVACLLSQAALTSDEDVASGESTFKLADRETLAPEQPHLTPTQQEIVGYVLQGLDERGIAAVMHRSPHTIHTHLKAIFQQLHVHSRSALILRLMQRTQ